MLLKVKALKKSYDGAEGPVPVLRGIDMSVAAGDTLALTGESGSGKSTLLQLIGGLDTASGGEVRLNGQDICQMDDAGRAAVRRKHVGIIFQQFNLIPSLDVTANIAFQARLAGLYDAQAARDLSDALGLGDSSSESFESRVIAVITSARAAIAAADAKRSLFTSALIN